MRSARPQLRKIFNKYIRNNTTPSNSSDRAVMGKPDGTLSTGNSNTVWVTYVETGQVIEVLNRRVVPAVGKIVNVGYDPDDFPLTRQVLGYADVYPDPTWAGPDVMSHSPEHDFGGQDCDWVVKERIVRWVPVVNETKFYLYSTVRYQGDGTWYWNKTPVLIDFTSEIPTAGSVISIVTLRAGVLQFVTGTAINGTMYDLTQSDIPELPATDLGIVGLRLYAGMSQAYHEPGRDTFIDLSEIGGSVGAASIPDGIITNAMLVDMPAYTVKANMNGATAAPQDATATQLMALGLGAFAGTLIDISDQVDGIKTSFNLTGAAYGVLVLVDGGIAKAGAVTFTPGASTFTLSFAPQAGVNLQYIKLAPVAAPIVNDYILFRGEFSAGTSGGTFTSGAWQTRTINAKPTDSGNHGDLPGSNIIRLLNAGTYIFKISAPALHVAIHQARLYNVTLGATVPGGEGTVEDSWTADNVCNRSFIAGKITISSQTDLRVEHRCQTTYANYGFGIGVNFGEKNIYTIAEFWKVG